MALVINVLARRAWRAHNAEDREVVGFGAAAGEHDSAGVAAEPPGHGAARAFEPLFRRLPEIMDTGRVAVDFRQQLRQGAQHLRRDRGCRVMIEVKMPHSSV